MKAKYDKIGIKYNVTRKADQYLTQRLLANLTPSPTGTYLDIGCGTGNYTNELYKSGYHFIGIDPSNEMLHKAKQQNKNIHWKIGQAEKTGLENESIDGIIGSLTIHHWTDLEKGFREMFRVLKKEGNIVIFTSTPKQMKGYWLNHYFPKMLQASIEQMPSFKNVEQAIYKAGFTTIRTEIYSVRSNLMDLFLYSGKHNPNLYFKPEVRNGISSFSSLANREEVNLGLSKMKWDIENGKIADIMKSYENDLGDYLFIVGKKIHFDKNIQRD